MVECKKKSITHIYYFRSLTQFLLFISCRTENQARVNLWRISLKKKSRKKDKKYNDSTVWSLIVLTSWMFPLSLGLSLPICTFFIASLQRMPTKIKTWLPLSRKCRNRFSLQRKSSICIGMRKMFYRKSLRNWTIESVRIQFCYNNAKAT